MNVDEIIGDFEHMKKYGEFFKYQHTSMDEAICLIKEYKSPEIQRLIELGRAVEKVFKFRHANINAMTDKVYYDFDRLDELIEWYHKEI